jgi:uncharacterized protein (TIGR00725 family)
MEKSSKKLQIGVMGSAADLRYSKNFEKMAEETGYWVAKNGAILIFGAEKDYDSLSTAACRGAKKAGGLTIGVTYGKGLDVFEKKNVDVVIASGLERGGGRELTLVLSCDAVIALNGGSGTLTEIAIAYQANIPVVVLKNSGGWSEKLGGQYLDNRKRIKIETARTPRAAVGKAILLTRRENFMAKDILFLTAVHGDEKIGVDIMSKLEKSESDKISWLVANEKAILKKARFVDVDLNRVAPGKQNAKQYEYRRAKELLEVAKNFRYMIDIHGNKANSGIFTIVTNPKLENLLLASALPVENIVIWAATKSKKFGPITQFVNCGVEIECGPKNSETKKKQLSKIINGIIQKGIVANNQSLSSKRWFRVLGKLKKDEVKPEIIKQLKDFKQITLNKETFYPLLIGEYNDAVCYKMEAIDFFDKFAY